MREKGFSQRRLRSTRFAGVMLSSEPAWPRWGRWLVRKALGRNTDATMNTNGVEVAVVARGAISPPLLQGLVAEIPHSEKGWEPMQHDLSICTARGISRDNVRLEARGNQRSTKGVPCTCTQSLTCALGQSTWNKYLLQLREAFVNTGNVKVRLKTHTKGGNVVLLASNSFE
jgi:hypothetical protein